MTRFLTSALVFAAAAGAGWRWGSPARNEFSATPRSDNTTATPQASVRDSPGLTESAEPRDVPLTVAGLQSLVDPLDDYRTNRRLRTALANAGLDDLRSLVKSAGFAGLASQSPLATAAAERWLELDFDSALRVVSEAGGMPETFARTVLTAAARRQPAELLGWWGRLSDSGDAAMRGQMEDALLTKADFGSFHAARSRLATVLGPMTTEDRQVAATWRTFLGHWLGRSPREVRQWMDAQPKLVMAEDERIHAVPVESPERAQWGPWSNALSSNSRECEAGRDPREALASSLERAVAAGNPEEETRIVKLWLENWTNRDPAVAAAWLREHPPADVREVMPLQVAQALARTDGPAAVALARTFPEPLRWQALQMGLMEWARRDFAAASQAAAAEPAGPSWENALKGLAELAGDQPLSAAVAWGEKLPPTLQEAAARKIFPQLARQEPVETAQQLARWLSAGRPVDADTVHSVAVEWGCAQPEAAADWAIRLPDSARDAALQPILESWRRVDPDAAEVWQQRQPPR